MLAGIGVGWSMYHDIIARAFHALWTRVFVCLWRAQSLRAAAVAEQDRLRAQWQLEMEIREKRMLQTTMELERRLEDAVAALKHERGEAAREKQLRLDTNDAMEDLGVRACDCGVWHSW